MAAAVLVRVRVLVRAVAWATALWFWNHSDLGKCSSHHRCATLQLNRRLVASVLTLAISVAKNSTHKCSKCITILAIQDRQVKMPWCSRLETSNNDNTLPIQIKTKMECRRMLKHPVLACWNDLWASSHNKTWDSSNQGNRWISHPQRSLWRRTHSRWISRLQKIISGFRIRIQWLSQGRREWINLIIYIQTKINRSKKL